MNQQELQLTGGLGKEKRRELDFYPTPQNITHALMKFLHKECDWHFDRPLTIWEPACGDGDMSEVIKSYGHTVLSSDINTSYGETSNFLTNHLYGKVDAIITNPPFNISQNFIELSLNRRSKIVCMLLKSQYWHAKKRYKLFTDHPPQYVLPLTWRPDFLEHTRNKEDKSAAPTMEVAWSVWIKGAHTETRYIPLLKP